MEILTLWTLCHSVGIVSFNMIYLPIGMSELKRVKDNNDNNASIHLSLEFHLTVVYLVQMSIHERPDTIADKII